jgi:hypothetical protein
MSKKLFRIEMATTEYIWADTKDNAIADWHKKYDVNSSDNWHHFDFNLTGQVWEVPFEKEKNWVKLKTDQQKKI